MSFNTLLNKTCTIQTKTESQSGTGSITESWGNTYTSVPCRYNRANASKGSTFAGQYQVTIKDFIFYFKSDATIGEGSRIVVDGKTFNVQQVFKDSAGHHYEVFARLVTFE